jgi:hypothetical protein
LGDRIVRELELDESTDTLGRWMAHRVAELIDGANRAQSNSARSRAAGNATDLILRLWAQRSNWPQGWPPETAVKILTALEPKPFRTEGPHSGSPWLDRIAQLDDVHARDRRTWFGTSLFDFDFEAEGRALEGDSGDLRDEEREVLERLQREREWASRELFDGGVPQSTEQRASVVRRKLAALKSERERLIAEVIRAIKEMSGGARGGKRRKKPAKASRKASGDGMRRKSARRPRTRRAGQGR